MTIIHIGEITQQIVAVVQAHRTIRSETATDAEVLRAAKILRDVAGDHASRQTGRMLVEAMERQTGEVRV